MGKKGEKDQKPLSKADLAYLIEHTKYNKHEIRYFWEWLLNGPVRSDRACEAF